MHLRLHMWKLGGELYAKSIAEKKKPRRWFFWNARNKFYFDKVQRPLKSIIGGALGFLVEYQRLNATQRIMQTAALFFCIAVHVLLYFPFIWFLVHCSRPGLYFIYSFTSIKFQSFISKTKGQSISSSNI